MEVEDGEDGENDTLQVPPETNRNKKVIRGKEVIGTKVN
jgi:hypothetical protein